MREIQEPTQTISTKAATVWRINSALWRGIFLLLLGVGLYLTFHFDWNHWIQIAIYIMIAYSVLRLIYKVTIYPIYMQRTWRYEIDEDFVQIKNGFINKYHAVIPMSRVEYVNTDQGPLLRKFGLATLTIGTLTSPHEIPALTNEEATEIRSKIVYYAKINNPVEEIERAQLHTEQMDDVVEKSE